MKSILFTVILMASFQVKALTNEKIAELYNSGKIETKAISLTKISASQKRSLLEKMSQVAKSLANIWPDTVLEGPYTLLEDPKLDAQVEALFLGKELVGYSGYVYASAAFSDECSFNDDLEETQAEREYRACLEDFKGSISEQFLVNIKGAHVEEFVGEAEFSSFND